MYIVKYNLTNIKYNPTNNSVCVWGGGGGYKCIFKIHNIKKKVQIFLKPE